MGAVVLPNKKIPEDRSEHPPNGRRFDLPFGRVMVKNALREEGESSERL
jgi:hypothetical protein